MYLNGSLVLVFKIAKRSIKLHPTKEVEPTEIEKTSNMFYAIPETKKQK